jgi:hypothetical protein
MGPLWEEKAIGSSSLMDRGGRGFGPDPISQQNQCLRNGRRAASATDASCEPFGSDGQSIEAVGGSIFDDQFNTIGRISASGQVRMNAVAGPRSAHGTGRFNQFQGSGTWAGTGPSCICFGVWNATRS